VPAPAPVSISQVAATPVEEAVDEEEQQSDWKPIAPPAPDTSWGPLATPNRAVTPQPLAPPAPDSTWKPLAPPAPDSTWKPLAPPAPDSSVKPAVVPAPDTSWKPLAPPAPATRWPGEVAADASEPESAPDDYVDAPVAFAPRRSRRPFVLGGLAVAAAAVIAAFTLGGSEAADSSAGALAAQQPPAQVPRARPAPPPPTPAESAALQAGLANLQTEAEAQQPPIEPVMEETPVQGTDSGARRSNTDSSAPRLSIPVPSLAIDNVTKSIESAARARVDSLTQASDKQVYEYTGKKPRQ
jgi:hypothetical protein